MGTLKPQSNGNTVIGTLVVDGWAVTIGTARARGRAMVPPSSLLAVPNITSPVNGHCTVLYYSM